MQSLVVSTLFTHLMGSGCAVLRFNFRGVGRSEGDHDFGEGEQLDVRAAVDALAGAGDGQSPLVLAGWSFGADLALTCDAPELAGWFLVAPPLRVLDAGRFQSRPRSPAQVAGCARAGSVQPSRSGPSCHRRLDQR